jgi:Raf kinase inhibitor-like YbhB/YbcL family protein
MLEKLPHAVGHALKNVKAGLSKTLYFQEELAGVAEVITVTSPAFANGQALPARFTADGEKLSPPLSWRGVPQESVSLVLVIEDADSPTSAPLTHAVVLDLPPTDGELKAGELPGPGRPGETHQMGRNSYLRSKYLPPDPPPGHGPHRYLFQLFALDVVINKSHPSIARLRECLKDHAVGKGLLIGTYART